MDKKKKVARPYSSLLSYYQDNKINPVPISLNDQAAWESHVAKRRNLYEMHLRVPLSLLRGRSILEFGCNSGENAIVLASVGANLTLVEPNYQVLPRLRELFKKFGLEQRINALVQETIGDFEPNELYDVVIAEGFLNHLPNGKKMLKKICRLISPGGLGVISFDDRYGHFIEIIRKLVFWRVCRLNGIENVFSEGSLGIARQLYLKDFLQLKASRPFEAWWQDVLLNPFVSWKYLLTYQELIPLLVEVKCEFYSSSPKWVSINNYLWYKNVPEKTTMHENILDNWRKLFPYFLTGIHTYFSVYENASEDVLNSVSELISHASDYIKNPNFSIDLVSYPSQLDKYFERSKELGLLRFNSELKELFQSIKYSSANDLISTYHNTKHVRSLWGTPCHYICFIKSA